MSEFLGQQIEKCCVLYRLDAHTDTVSTAAAHTTLVVTGSWDKTIRLWRWPQLLEDSAAGNIPDLEDPKDGNPKRPALDNTAQDTENNTQNSQAVGVVGESASMLQGHAQVRTFFLPPFLASFCFFHCCAGSVLGVRVRNVGPGGCAIFESAVHVQHW